MWFLPGWNVLLRLLNTSVHRTLWVRLIAVLGVTLAVSVFWLAAYQFLPSVRSWVSAPQDGETS